MFEDLKNTIKTINTHKLPCEIVYQTAYRTISEQGIIRDVFLKGKDTLIVLETGLPIPLTSILSIQIMEA